MNTASNPTALIAEDEPLLAAALQAELKKVWPELAVVAVVGNGQAAVEQAFTLKPDVVFLDIRMPGMTGLEAAAELADEWPADEPPFPALVFVTAYDEYALQAFEAQAMDYVLKPVQTERLKRTTQRLQAALAQREDRSTPTAEPAMDATLAQLRALLSAPTSKSTANAAEPERLKVIQASVGNGIRMVPIGDVVVFEAADKYVRVLTAAHEYLIRTPLKDLLPQLDPFEFWQVHRGTVVRATAIDNVQRDEAGKTSLTLRERAGERVAVSRVYAQRFRAM
jgi:DNA-binding LytR/AlgR family response regulator